MAKKKSVKISEVGPPELKAYLRITAPIMPEGGDMTPDTLVVKCSQCGAEVFRIKGISALQFKCRP